MEPIEEEEEQPPQPRREVYSLIDQQWSGSGSGERPTRVMKHEPQPADMQPPLPSQMPISQPPIEIEQMDPSPAKHQ